MVHKIQKIEGDMAPNIKHLKPPKSTGLEERGGGGEYIRSPNKCTFETFSRSYKVSLSPTVFLNHLRIPKHVTY